MLNESYYIFLKTGTDIIDGILILKVEHIIPFKAKAWLDLTQRKAKGKHVDSKDINLKQLNVFGMTKSTVLEMLYLFYNINKEQHKLNEREVTKALSEI